jgi:two-component system KDP operon response regulator KdpE
MLTTEFQTVFTIAGQHGKAALESSPAGRLLIVDHDPFGRRTLHSALHSLGFDVDEASSADEGIALCRVVSYDAVLVDSAAVRSGTDICGKLRRILPRVALFMMSVNGDYERRIEALEAGADAYIDKPFHIQELTARIRAMLRCIRACTDRADQRISIGHLELHPSLRLVVKAGEPVSLTPKEFDLLHYMMTHAGLPIVHSQLLEVVWGPGYVNELEYLRNVVRQIRKKIEDDPGTPRYLLTDCGIGYRFVAR